MLDIGMQELLVVMVIALLVFGPYKLPELGRALGRAMREFRRASDEFRSTIETNLNINEESVLAPSASIAAASEADQPSVDSTGVDPEDTAAPGGDPALEISAPSDPVPFGPAQLDRLEVEGASGGPEFAETVVPRLDGIEPFWAQRGGRLLHRSGCGWAGRIAEAERVVFKRVGEARESGFQLCPVCGPEDEEVSV